MWYNYDTPVGGNACDHCSQPIGVGDRYWASSVTKRTLCGVCFIHNVGTSRQCACSHCGISLISRVSFETTATQIVCYTCFTAIRHRPTAKGKGKKQMAMGPGTLSPRVAQNDGNCLVCKVPIKTGETFYCNIHNTKWQCAKCQKGSSSYIPSNPSVSKWTSRICQTQSTKKFSCPSCNKMVKSGDTYYETGVPHNNSYRWRCHDCQIGVSSATRPKLASYMSGRDFNVPKDSKKNIVPKLE